MADGTDEEPDEVIEKVSGVCGPASRPWKAVAEVGMPWEAITVRIGGTVTVRSVSAGAD